MSQCVCVCACALSQLVCIPATAVPASLSGNEGEMVRLLREGEGGRER